MPIGLLLQETVYTLRWGAFHLEPWSHLVRIEALLIERARGAFLSRWFGAALPLKSFDLRVMIANLAELRERYFRARMSFQSDDGPNLAEPVAGLGGEIAGIALSPTGSILMLVLLVKDFKFWTGQLVKLLGWSALAAPLVPFLGPVLGPVLIPIAAAGMLNENIVLLGASAQLLMEATNFLKLLLGPRENLKNPVLAGILTFFDLLAGLVPFVLAAIAIIIVEILPLIPPLLAQLGPFQALIGDVIKTVSFIFTDLMHVFDRFTPIVADVLDFVTVQLANIFPLFSIAMTEMITNLAAKLGKVIEAGSTSIKTWVTTAKGNLRDLIRDQPLMRQLQAARIVFKVMATAFKSDKPEEPPGWFSKHILAPIKASVAGGAKAIAGHFPRPQDYLTPPDRVLAQTPGRPPKGLDAIGIIAGIDIKHGGALLEDYLPFSDEARAGLRAIKPTHVFAEERRDLNEQEAKAAKPPPGASALPLTWNPAMLHGVMRAVVERILPPALQVEIGTLKLKFAAVAAVLLGDEKEQAKHPVRDLPDNGKLVPVVHRLVIRSGNLTGADAKVFARRLQDAMTGLAYPAMAPARAAA
jgi:hypothetical protein